MIDSSDTELIALARAGERAAFGHLIKRYQIMVERITFKMVRDAFLARELRQEAFLQAYLSLHRLRDDARFQSWLYGITLNVCKSYLRQRTFDFLSLESLMGGMRIDPALLAAGAPDPETVVEQRELHCLVLKAVNELTPRNRDATLLYYYDQLTVREIASLLEISISAVKGRLHRSRQYLKLKLLSHHRGAHRRERTPQVLATQMGERSTDMVKVKVADVIKQKVGDDPLIAPACVVILLDEAKKRLLPIWMGPAEGMSMALYLFEYPVVRPLTFTFMANLLEASGVELETVSVSALEGETYYATVTIRVGEMVQELDARPSDAINLALHTGRPLYVAESVMEKSGIDIADRDALPKGMGLDQIKGELAEQLQREEKVKCSWAEKSEEELVQMQEEFISFVLGSET